MTYKAPRGTRDILPPETSYLEYIRKNSYDVLKAYGYQQIETPILESTDLFVRGIGKLTDIVEKEMYTFNDKKGRSLTLRPEGTASIVRAYIQNSLYRGGLQKLYYQGPMFRYERPQAGRYRQFEQIGVETLGTQDPIVDAEVIAIALKICQRLGIKEAKVAINSVGCKVCRPVIREQLKSFIVSSLKYLCADCKRRYQENPLRILDCKKKSCQTYFANMPTTTAVLCHECADHYSSVLEYLSVANIPYDTDPNLVRGLDYYTKTAFEIRSDLLGAQNAICGGGRYDELVEELGGPHTPAFGFAFGIDRMLMIIKELQALPDSVDNAPLIYFIGLGEVARRRAFACRNELCDNGIPADMDLQKRSLKTQFKQANARGARYVCVIGQEELAKGICQLKTMSSGHQEPVALADLLKHVRQIIEQ
jgi:histidyl-tRNA synthetase